MSAWSPLLPMLFSPNYLVWWVGSSKESPCCFKLLPCTHYRGHCALGNFHCSRNVFVAFYRFVPPHNPVSELYRQLFPPYGLVLVLICIVSCVSFKKMSNAFPTDGLQSKCINISKMIKRNWRLQS
ncbi:hypothetical protein GDO78_016921 [Eleutherodactylus coqui]|uniref:Uncharacterized protein n=1 Tax=Eleutherodactylus coqui TaxID=57060 RepID=A0A8J6ECS4_ELECQ|nr:hypothetical protein GDO78_016921 [Eleutherodactylus coqui]